MNCKRCSSHLSDFVERELDESMEAEVRAHLADCLRCQRDLEDFERSLEALREVLRQSPEAAAPEGLEERIAKSLDDSQLSPSSPRPSRVPAEHVAIFRRRALVRRVLTAAALFLMLAVGFLAGHERWLAPWITVSYRNPSQESRHLEAERQREEIETRLADMRRELLEDFQTTLQEHQARFATALQKSEDRNAETQAQTQARTQKRRVELEDHVVTLEAKIDELEGSLRGARRQTRELQIALAEHERVRTDLEARLTAKIDALTRAHTDEAESAADSSPGRPSPASAVTDSRSEAERVVFRRRGETLELEVYGPPSVIVPLLFRVAREAQDPGRASLALNHVETLLALDIEEEPVPRKSNGGYFQSIGEKIASLADPLDLRPHPELVHKTDDFHDRRSRLRRAKAAWRARGLGRTAE